eukprot:TRINITY_DN3079_c3_g8_i1.p1 TRINITY_DN3079_c3_g8~~TRINITY_DN3079_c3_g8_i1.p1  ORF type:complete len:841 (+),score=327.84 TRINITY_DN3079_c3_g8_i1:41-2524(+)
MNQYRQMGRSKHQQNQKLEDGSINDAIMKLLKVKQAKGLLNNINSDNNHNYGLELNENNNIKQKRPSSGFANESMNDSITTSTNLNELAIVGMSDLISDVSESDYTADLLSLYDKHVHAPTTIINTNEFPKRALSGSLPIEEIAISNNQIPFILQYSDSIQDPEEKSKFLQSALNNMFVSNFNMISPNAEPQMFIQNRNKRSNEVVAKEQEEEEEEEQEEEEEEEEDYEKEEDDNESGEDLKMLVQNGDKNFPLQTDSSLASESVADMDDFSEDSEDLRIKYDDFTNRLLSAGKQSYKAQKSVDKYRHNKEKEVEMLNESEISGIAPFDELDEQSSVTSETNDQESIEANSSSTTNSLAQSVGSVVIALLEEFAEDEESFEFLTDVLNELVLIKDHLQRSFVISFIKQLNLVTNNLIDTSDEVSSNIAGVTPKIIPSRHEQMKIPENVESPRNSRNIEPHMIIHQASTDVLTKGYDYDMSESIDPSLNSEGLSTSDQDESDHRIDDLVTQSQSDMSTGEVSEESEPLTHLESSETIESTAEPNEPSDAEITTEVDTSKETEEEDSVSSFNLSVLDIFLEIVEMLSSDIFSKYHISAITVSEKLLIHSLIVKEFNEVFQGEQLQLFSNELSIFLDDWIGFPLPIKRSHLPILLNNLKHFFIKFLDNSLNEISGSFSINSHSNSHSSSFNDNEEEEEEERQPTHVVLPENGLILEDLSSTVKRIVNPSPNVNTKYLIDSKPENKKLDFQDASYSDESDEFAFKLGEIDENLRRKVEEMFKNEQAEELEDYKNKLLAVLLKADEKDEKFKYFVKDDYSDEICDPKTFNKK